LKKKEAEKGKDNNKEEKKKKDANPTILVQPANATHAE
jgi:hypothetical protein